MEAWAWVIVVIALVLLVAGTLRFDLLLPAVRERLGARFGDDKDGRTRASAHAGGGHGHGAAAHTGHVAPHGSAALRRRLVGLRAQKRH